MSSPIERRRNPFTPVLPVTPEVVARGYEIIAANQEAALKLELKHIAASNPHLARHISAFARAVGEVVLPQFKADIFEGAAWAHLLLRLQLQKSSGAQMLSQENRNALPRITEGQRQQHSDAFKRSGELSGLDLYNFFVARGALLESFDPGLSTAMDQLTANKFPMLQPSESDQMDNIPSLPILLKFGASEVYFLVYGAAYNR
ncbi:MAG: hypothetical protein WBO77_01225 [Microgenomates group bacterium]